MHRNADGRRLTRRAVLVGALVFMLAHNGADRALSQAEHSRHSTSEPAVDCVLPGDSRCEEWTVSHDVGQFDRMSGMAASPDGSRVFVTGTNGVSGQASNNFITAAFDGGTGAFLWTATYDGPAGIEDVPRMVRVTPDGATVIVAGGINNAGIGQDRTDYGIVAYDAATGIRRWVSTYDSGLYDLPMDLTVSPGGEELYITGMSRGALGGVDLDFVTVGIDVASGDRLWVARDTSNRDGSYDTPLAVEASPDGKTVAVAGFWQVPGGKLAYGVLAYRAGDDEQAGQRLWQETHGHGWAWDVAFSPDSSRVYVTGEDQRGDTQVFDFGTVAFDAATGSKLWVDDYSTCRQSCTTYSLAVGPDDTVYVSGEGVTEHNAALASMDMHTVAFRGATGERRWVSVYDVLTRDQYRTTVRVSPSTGEVLVGGITYFYQRGAELTTVSLDVVTGAVRWDARYGLPTSGARFDPSVPAFALAKDHVFIGGIRAEGAGALASSDYFVAAYGLGT